tara:strand:- start:1249 stop:1407 length:159 start_codon:yes stop_codon:yes gene_type:complete
MIDRLLVGEFYHQTTKLTCLIFLLIFLTSCSSNNKVPKPIGTLYKIITGDIR